jgi:thymidylate synthase
MNSLDKQYQDLLQDILDNGVTKSDRTGTGTISVFGRQIRHKMSGGFPLLTTKKMPFKTIVTELMWFLRGDTNIKFLVDNNCHIWDGDAYKNYANSSELRADLSKEEFIHNIKMYPEFAKKWGELGPVYGKQWRSWTKPGIKRSKEGIPMGYKIDYIDQIANLIRDLKTNPDSRRLMVTAWNVGELDQMTLPPCHYGFQVYTRELSNEEIAVEANKRGFNLKGMTISGKLLIDPKEVKEKNLPTRAISLMWNQRSVDTFLGLPFNIASYGLLLEIIAKAVNMVPDELIGNLGDTHLYSNHIEQAKEQIGRELSLEERNEIHKNLAGHMRYHIDKLDLLKKIDYSGDLITHEILDELGVPKRKRQPYSLPTLKIENEVKWAEGDCLPTYSVNDFTIENYQSHPAIKAPLSN